MRLLTAIFLAGMAMSVQAGQIPITVDFNEPDPYKGFQFNNECSDGPGWEWSFPNPGADQTFWMSHFCPHEGDLLPQVIITRTDGRPFSLLGFDHATYDVVVRSSRGGHVLADPWTGCDEYSPPGCQWDMTTDITDPLFTNVQWVSFCPECDGIDYQHSIGIYDNIRFSVQVPEPAPLTLIGIALVGLALIRRRATFIV